MPYTKTPSIDTYSQEDIVLTKYWSSRQGSNNGAKDEQFLNCFFENVSSKDLQDRRQYVTKRAGSSIFFIPPVDSPVRGAYFWPDQKLIAYCILNDVYIYDPATEATITCSNVFSTTTGSVGFTTFLFDDGVVDLIATDGVDLLQIETDGTTTTCSSPDMPTPHLPKPIFIDGYLCLVEKDTASIWNSDLNDPMAWTAGNFINAEMDGDWIVNIDKINNYIVAFGSTSIEYFWDAGVESGSPFQRNETPIKINQYIGGLAKYGNALFYIGSAAGGQVDVFKLQDFQIEAVGSPTVTRYLSSLTDDFSTYYGGIVSCLGHTFYLLNAGGRTFVFDVETKYWYRWAFKDFNSFSVSNAIQLSHGDVVGTLFNIESSRIFYLLDDNVYSDNSTNFTMRIVTDPIDFGTLDRKTMSKLVVLADSPGVDSNVIVSYTDDDYQTYSSPITCNLNQDLPSITRLGSFRQRAFKLEYTDNYPLRIQKLQANINKGRN
jgi:hypothetical protein